MFFIYLKGFEVLTFMIYSNQQLYQILKKGDQSSFKIVYDHFYSRLYYFVLEYVSNSDIAENVVQDTFLTLWEKYKQLTEDTNLNAYLYTVAKNNSLKFLRDQKYSQKLFISNQLSSAELELNVSSLEKLDTSILVFEEIETIINQTLESLPEQCRIVFEFSRFEQKKNREIAELLGISTKTVEGHITKALKAFKSSLKEYLPLVVFFMHPFLGR